MRALVWEVSVTIPACEPVNEIARCPRSLIAIAHSAHEMRSPVDSNMSISRGSGFGDTSSAIAISSSVVFPRADSTATTRLPASRFSTIRRAARLIRSASATDVPPNFMTTVSGTYSARLPTSARPSVSSSAYSRSAPTGSPLASRVTMISESSAAQPGRDVERRRLPGGSRVGGDHHLAHGVGGILGHPLVQL